MLERESGIVVSESVFRYFIHANLFFSLDDTATIAKKLSFFLHREYILCINVEGYSIVYLSKHSEVFVLKENQII